MCGRCRIRPATHALVDVSVFSRTITPVCLGCGEAELGEECAPAGLRVSLSNTQPQVLRSAPLVPVA